MSRQRSGAGQQRRSGTGQQRRSGTGQRRESNPVARRLRDQGMTPEIMQLVVARMTERQSDSGAGVGRSADVFPFVPRKDVYRPLQRMLTDLFLKWEWHQAFQGLGPWDESNWQTGSKTGLQRNAGVLPVKNVMGKVIDGGFYPGGFETLFCNHRTFTGQTGRKGGPAGEWEAGGGTGGEGKRCRRPRGHYGVPLYQGTVLYRESMNDWIRGYERGEVDLETVLELIWWMDQKRLDFLSKHGDAVVMDLRGHQDATRVVTKQQWDAIKEEISKVRHGEDVEERRKRIRAERSAIRSRNRLTAGKLSAEVWRMMREDAEVMGKTSSEIKEMWLSAIDGMREEFLRERMNDVRPTPIHDWVGADDQVEGQAEGQAESQAESQDEGEIGNGN